ncbi:MAG: ATP synthase subunit C [Pleomorphochaeta sp.]|nr:ATP synthase subunit C [Sphaerochaetaceae bacterium]
MTKIAFERKVKLSVIATLFMMFASAFVFTPSIFASGTVSSANPQTGMICLAAAIAFAMGALAAGIAIGNVGAAAMGAISEKPELASQALIFIALAEGLVVFGFIIALMILGKA